VSTHIHQSRSRTAAIPQASGSQRSLLQSRTGTFLNLLSAFFSSCRLVSFLYQPRDRRVHIARVGERDESFWSILTGYDVKVFL
jgi:hypothetical protein